MAAPIVKINEWNANSTKTDKTSSILRFKTEDSPVIDSTFGMAIPFAVGRLYSYEKWLRLAIDTGDPAADIRNIKFYVTGSSFGPGINLWNEVAASRTFRSAEQANSSLSIPLGGSGSKTMTNGFVYTAGSPLSLSSAAESFSGSNTDIGAYSVMVLEVTTAATSGTAAVVNFTFSYDHSAIQSTVNSSLTASIYGYLSKNTLTTFSKDAVVGKPVDDSGYAPVTGVAFNIDEAELLVNDFTAITEGSSTHIFIDSVTGFVNGSATIAGGTVTFIASGTGTCAFHYVGDYLGTLATGSVSLTATTASTTTTASSIAINYFGPAHAGGGGISYTLSKNGRQISYRFLAEHTGVLTGIKPYVSYNGTAGMYQGTSGSAGGTLRIRVYDNNSTTGASSTVANVPSSVLQTFYTLSASGAYTAKFTEFSGSCNLTASSIYHIVFENIHISASTNFVSIAANNQSWAPNPHNPAIPDLYEEVLTRNSSINTWTRETRFHILQLRYLDGSLQGTPYYEINTGSNDTGRLNVGTSSVHVRQSFSVPSSFSTQCFNVFGRTNTAVANDVAISFRQESNNALIGTISASVGDFNSTLGTDDWVVASASSALTFSGSVTYHWTMSAAAGSYGFASMREGVDIGISNGGAFESGIGTTEGWAQYSCGGTTYKGIMINSSSNSHAADWPWYFVKN